MIFLVILKVQIIDAFDKDTKFAAKIVEFLFKPCLIFIQLIDFLRLRLADINKLIDG